MKASKETDIGRLLPKEFKLGGHVYTVKSSHVFSEDTSVTGQHSTEVKEIRIKGVTPGGAKQAVTNQFQVFFHEVLHAIDQIYCMDSVGKEFPKELLLDALAEGMTQFLLENHLWGLPKE